MMRRIVCVLSILALIMAGLISAAPSSDGAIDAEVSRTMSVKNVYCAEFVSLGTLPSYEEDSYYFFIDGSVNHEKFLYYVNEDPTALLPPDDFEIIQEDDHVKAYFFSPEKYSNGYSAILEFYNFSGTVLKGYTQLLFKEVVEMDSVHHFFLKGSTAVIKWYSKPANLTVYFGGKNLTKIAEYDDELKCYVASVEIDKNGDYPLWFVNNNTDAITATVTYSVDGFDDSKSTAMAVVCAALAVVAAIILIMAHRRPFWSKGSGRATHETPLVDDDAGEVV